METFATNWASEASPTLGCSIKISRDIYGMCVVCQINCVGRITWTTSMLKVFWAVKTDLYTRVIDFDYTLEQL